MSQQRITCRATRAVLDHRQHKKGGRNRQRDSQGKCKTGLYRAVVSYWLEKGVCQPRIGGLHSLNNKEYTHALQQQEKGCTVSCGCSDPMARHECDPDVNLGLRSITTFVVLLLIISVHGSYCNG